MKLKTEIFIGPIGNVFELDTKDIDRNYDDEDYAYWIKEDYHGWIYEINVDKDENNGFLLMGFVSI